MSKKGASGVPRGAGRQAAEIARLRARVAELEAQVGRFRVLAEQSASLIFLYDLEAGRFVYANERFEELLGYSRTEITAPGFDLFTLVAPDSVEKVQSSHTMRLRGEEHLPFEFGMLARDGRRVAALISSWLTTYEGHPAVVGVITDLSSQQHLAEQLQGAVRRAASERALADSIIAALGEGIIVQDREYRITYQNEVNRRLFGDRVGDVASQGDLRVERAEPEPGRRGPVQPDRRDQGSPRTHLRDVLVAPAAAHLAEGAGPVLAFREGAP